MRLSYAAGGWILTHSLSYSQIPIQKTPVQKAAEAAPHSNMNSTVRWHTFIGEMIWMQCSHLPAGDQTTFTPKLTIFVRNGILLDASLSSDTRSHLKNLALQQSRPGSKSLEELDPPAQQHDHIPETPNDSGNVSQASVQG